MRIEEGELLKGEECRAERSRGGLLKTEEHRAENGRRGFQCNACNGLPITYYFPR